MTAPAYRDSDEHLWDELARIDELVRAQTIRWRLTVAAYKPEHLWGMVHVTDAEIDAYLGSAFAPPPDRTAELEPIAAPCLDAARARREGIDARVAATADAVDLRLVRLCRAFRLTAAERDALLVCLMPELDGRFRRLYGYLQDDASQASPTVELATEILAPVAGVADGRALFAPGGRLRGELLVVPDDRDDARPLPARPARVDERIVGHLLCSDRPDPALAGVLTEPAEPVAWEDVPVEPELAGSLRALAERPCGVVFLEGAYGSGRLAAARAVCTAAGIPLLVADVPEALRTGEPFERLVGRCLREARLRAAALYWARCDTLLEDDPPDPRWDRLIGAVESCPRPAFLAAARAWDPAGRLRDTSFTRLRFPSPGYQARRALWERCLPPTSAFAAPSPDRGALAERLANDFRLTHGRMLDALVSARADARQRDPHDAGLTAADLLHGCRRQSGRRLGSLARRIEPQHEVGFDDLVLPPASRRQLDELRARLRHHGRVHHGLGFDRRSPLAVGLVAMFTGGSGTGKTLAATLLATEHGVDLYKIDLSAVVSKYIGETEKNLSRVFAEAEDANAILFFDEADALFGKRGEVRDARDRWANIEVNHLLQRIEEFAGPVILASNLSQNIDQAFLRRIHVIVDFPFPDAAARLAIWQGVFPPGLRRPPDDELAMVADRFALTGGSIRNVALDATFAAVAAANGDVPAVGLGDVVAATVREYQKLSKPVTAGEFGEDLYPLVASDAHEGASR